MSTTTVRPAPTAAEDAARPATPREEATLLVSAGVLLVGLFADGFSHANSPGEIESFLTPAHALVFAGFLLCAAAVGLVVRARRSPDGGLLAATPPAWRQAALAVAAFGVAFVGDGVWHTVFGIESDIDALLSPTHLVLAGSMAVLFSTPVRTHDRLAPPTGAGRPDLPWRLAASVTATTMVVAFFLLYAWTIHFGLASAGAVDFLASRDGAVAELGQIAGLTGTLVVTGVLVAGATALLRRGTPPPGALALLLVLVPVAMSGIRDFEGAVTLPAFAVAALVVEVAVHRIDARTATVTSVWAATVWTSYWVLNALDAPLGWEPELYTGQVLSAAAMAWWLGVRATPVPAARVSTAPGPATP